MNKVFKVIWSDVQQAWVVVSELSKAHGKSKQTSAKANSTETKHRIGILLLSVSLGFSPLLVQANVWNAATGEWAVDGNWQDGTAPTSGNNATINNGGTAQISSGAAKANDINIGTTPGGSGTIEISNVATLTSSSNVSIGEGSGGAGTVTLTGSGTSFSNAYDFRVGRRGSGTLTISNGASVSVGSDFQAAQKASGDGTITVDGTGSQLTAGNNFTVGYYGNATLTISNGAVVSNDGEGHIGRFGGSEGSVTVDGIGSGWTVLQKLSVGNGGTGTLDIANGGSVSSSDSYVGTGTGSNGSVTVDGAGSGWTVLKGLRVGQYGTGTLDITNGGSVTSSKYSYVGSQTGSNGSVTVDGTGSGWTVLNSLDVGSSGTGTLEITNGGSVSSNDSYVGGGSNSNGSVTVDGTDSAWTVLDTLWVGINGIGTLAVTDGGSVNLSVVNNSYALDIGVFTGSSGTVTVDGAGSSLIHDTSAYIGDGGTGSLNITNGGSVTSSYNSYVGTGTGSNGSVTVDGTGSSWTVLDGLQVGNFGTGTLTITNGSSVNVDSSLSIGDETSGNGSVLVNGTDSSLTVNNTLYAGYSGIGTLTIGNNASVTSLKGRIGYKSSSQGDVTVDAGASWINSDYMEIGNFGTGTLTITNGGSVVNGGWAAIGDETGGNGVLTVSGAGSSFSSADELQVGYDGTGVLTLSDGGAIEVNSGSGLITIGTSFGTGTFNIGAAAGDTAVAAGAVNAGSVEFGEYGDGNLVFNHTNTDYEFAADISGYGSVDLYSGTTILTGDHSIALVNIDSGATLQVGNAGTTGSLGQTMSGEINNNGSLIFNRSDSVTVSEDIVGSGSLTQNGEGSGYLILTGTNTYTGGTTLSSGTLQIGDGGTTGSISGDIVTYGNVRFNRYDDVTFSNVISGNGNLVQVGAGTLTLTGANTYTGNTYVDYGTLAINSGGSVVDANKINIATISGSEAALTISNGGTANSYNGFVATNATATGTVTVDGAGSSWHINGSLFSIGHLGKGGLTISNGGSVSSDIATNYVGYSAGSTGTVIVDGSGSSWTADTNGITVGRSGTGTLTLRNGGSVTAVSGTGTLKIADQATGVGTVNIGAAADETAVAAGTVNAGSVTFGAGTGKLVFNHTDSAYSFAPDISGAGAVEFYNGVTSLDGSNTYSGTTTVNGGTLKVNNSSGSATGTSSVTINDGGTLGGTGIITGAVMVADGGIIAAGNSPGTLTVGDLTLNNSSILDFELDSPAGTPGIDSDLIVVNGNLTLDGVLNVTDLGGFAGSTGSYQLFSYSGSLTDNTLGLGNGAQAGYNYGIDTSTANQVSLVVDYTGLQFWDGSNTVADSSVSGGNGTWDATSTNWTSQNGGTNLAWSDLTAVFVGTAGTVEVDGTHTISGLQFGTDGYQLTDTDSNGALSLAASGMEIRADSGVTATIDLAMTGTGALTQSGSGTIILTADNSYSGGTTINSGILQLGNGGTTGSVVGDITNNGTLVFNRSDDLIYSNVISGSGSLNKLGANTLTLTGANTYSGVTTISAGTLQIGNGGTTGSITGDVVDNGALVFNRSDSLVFAGDISGTGSLAQSGTGTLTLTGTTTHSGGTTINSGTLQIGNGGTTGSISGDITNNGALAFNHSDDVTYSDVISGTGSLAQSGSGTLTLTGDNTYSGGTTINSGTLQLGNGGTTGSISSDITNNGTLTFNRSDDLTFSNIISGTGSLSKLAANTLTLTGANTYSGGTTISAGTLQIGNGGTTGSISGDITNNAALIFNRSDAVTYSDIISGIGSLTQAGSGTLVLSGDNTYSGDTIISAGTLQIGDGGTTGSVSGDITNNGTLAFNRSDDITFSNDISGTGSLSKLGSNTLTLTGDNTFSGGSTISAGTLQIGDGSSSGSISGDIANNGALIFNRTGSSTFSGVISGSGSFTKSGSGTLTLTGDNTYSGSTTISAGSLQIGNGGTTGSINGDITNNGALTFNRSDDVTYSNVISGSGSLTQSGSGTLILTNANTYSGGTTIRSGTLQLGNGGTTGSISGDISNDGTLAFSRSDDLIYSNVISGSGNLTKLGSNTLTLTADNTYSGVTTISAGTLQIGNGGSTGSISGDITNNGALIFNRTGTSTLSGVISGSGSLSKSGSGTLTLDGDNTYTGSTTINAGTLQIGDGGTTGSVTGDITNNGTLAFNRSDDVTFSNVIVGGGSLTQAGSGTLILTGANAYSGGTTISSGTLQIGNGGTSGNIGGDISNDGLLVFNRSDAQIFAGAISGTGSVTLASGTTRFTGNLGSLTGTVTVDGGSTLSIANGESLTLGGDYNQISGTLKLGASSTSSFGKLSVAGTATFAADAQVDVDVTEVNTLAVGQTLSGVISAGTLDASTFTLTDNSELFNLSAEISGNTVNLNLVNASSVTDSVIATNNLTSLGAAQVLDTFVEGGTTGTDMDNVVTALGKLATEQEVSDAVAETLPILVAGTASIASGTLHVTSRVVQARQDSFNGLSSGDFMLADQHLWVKPVGNWTEQDKHNGVSGYKADSYGFVGGLDGDINDTTKLGFAVSYMNTDVEGKNSASGNKADIDAYQAIVYGSRTLANNNNVELNWQADVGINKNEGTRNISFMNRVAKADYDSYTAHIGVGAGHSFKFNDKTTLVPSIRADYAYIKDEGYSETGADALNLNVDSNSSDELIVMARGNLSHELNDQITLLANAGIGYDLLSDATSLTASYAGGGTAFTTRGIDPSPWIGSAGAGINYNISDTSEITARYDVEGRSDFLSQTASVKFRWLF